MRPAATFAALVLAAGGMAAPAAAQSVEDALTQGDLICEFREGWRRSLIADLVGEPDPVALLLVYENVSAPQAAVLSSRTPGRKPVRVREGEGRMHFIEHVGASLRVTTLTGCERTKWKDGVETCVRFTARHAWHFDRLALRDPDASFERQPSGASVGNCEPWKVD